VNDISAIIKSSIRNLTRKASHALDEDTLALKQFINSMRDDGKGETEGDGNTVPWNYLINDKDMSDTLEQLHFFISCSDLNLKKKNPMLAGGWFKSKPKVEDGETIDWTIDCAFVTISICKGVPATFHKDILKHTVGENVREKVKDAQTESCYGNAVEDHVMDIPLHSLYSDGSLWTKIGYSPRVKLGDGDTIYFPTAVALHCLKTQLQPTTVFKFELWVKIDKKSTECIGFCDLTYDILLLTKDKQTFELLSPRSESEHKGVISMVLLNLGPPPLMSLSKHFYHMLQHYQFVSTNHEELAIREVAIEDCCSYQVPYLYLLMRANDYNVLQLNAETEKDREAYQSIVSKYHEQLQLLERGWLSLRLRKPVPRAFKSSTTRKVMGIEGIPTNLHVHICEVKSATATDVYEIVTMGCPAVHTMKSKSGGLRRQLEGRECLRSSAVQYGTATTFAAAGATPKPSKTSAPESPKLPKSARKSMMPSKTAAVSELGLKSPGSSSSLLKSPGSSSSLTGKMFGFLNDNKEGERRDSEDMAYSRLCSKLDPSIPIIMTGYLEKKGQLNTGAKKRFFILTPHLLEYYKSETNTDPQGVIPIDAMLLIKKHNTSAVTPSLSFDIITANRLYSLQAFSAADLQLWVDNLNAQLGKRVNSIFDKPPDLTTIAPPHVLGENVTIDGIVLDIEDVDSNLYGEVSPAQHSKLVEEARWRTQPQVISGWMSKLHSASRQWRKHYFRLYGSILRYFTNEVTMSSIGIIDMNYISEINYDVVERIITMSGDDHVFILKPSVNSMYSEKWATELKRSAANCRSTRKTAVRMPSDGLYTSLKDLHSEVANESSIISQIRSGQFETIVPDEAVLGDEYMEHFCYRKDLACAQMLAAVVTSFKARLEICVKSNPKHLERIVKLGFLVQLESLLSTSWNEISMLEDTDVAVREMRTCRIKITKVESAYQEVDNMEIKRMEGGLITVIIRVKDDLWQRLPAAITSNPSAFIPIIPVFFTQGINEMQWLSNTMGDALLVVQERINIENFDLIQEYCAQYVTFMEEEYSLGRGHAAGPHEEARKSSAEVKKVKEAAMESIIVIRNLMDKLQHVLFDDKVKKDMNYEILNLAGRMTREVGGGRITCCKSGKDRTGMSTTLEFARILRDHYYIGIPLEEKHRDYLYALRMMRIYGVRLSIARKNIGTPTFAFNGLQRKMLPIEYRPPTVTCHSGSKS
jgi:hypothetical protein